MKIILSENPAGVCAGSTGTNPAHPAETTPGTQNSGRGAEPQTAQGARVKLEFNCSDFQSSALPANPEMQHEQSSECSPQTGTRLCNHPQNPPKISLCPGISQPARRKQKFGKQSSGNKLQREAEMCLVLLLHD